jgi:hypothetical protein
MNGKVIATVIMSFWLSHTALACVQLYLGPTWIKGSRLTGRVTYQGKPLPRSRLELHRAINFTKEEVQRNGVGYEPPVLKTTVTDIQGRFSFGQMPPGKYWIVMKSPSHESFGVGLVSPGQKGEEQLRIEAWADWCTKTTAEEVPAAH